LARRLERLRKIAKKIIKKPRGIVSFGKVNK